MRGISFLIKIDVILPITEKDLRLILKKMKNSTKYFKFYFENLIKFYISRFQRNHSHKSIFSFQKAILIKLKKKNIPI